MAARSSIEWTDATWNPTRGCTRVSPGCYNCYAERMARRLSAPGRAYEGLTRRASSGPRWTGRVDLVADALQVPLRWRKPRVIFVNSMSDLFHEAIPDDFLARIFDVMGRAHWHTFQVLTKRSGRLRERAPRLSWPPNVWMGVSVETDSYFDRIDDLRRVPAAVRFLSLEPLLGRMPSVPLDGIHWVIVGGESGPGARLMDPSWVREIRDQCQAVDVPFFFKQWGGVRKSQAGRVLDGVTWNEMPATGLFAPQAAML